ncbi:MAG: hypothetical protein ACRD2Z_16320 [Thermoanaerobaculia bacterium]
MKASASGSSGVGTGIVTKYCASAAASPNLATAAICSTTKAVPAGRSDGSNSMQSEPGSFGPTETTPAHWKGSSPLVTVIGGMLAT